MRFVLIVAIGSAISWSSFYSQDAPSPREDVLAHAQSLMEARDFDRAGEVLAEFLRNDPNNEAANVKLGQLRITQGLFEDALKSFETVLMVKPNSAAARDGEVKAAEAAALADRKIGIDGSALLSLIRARKFVPDSPQLLLDFGIQAERMKIYKDADAALTKAHQLAPDDPKILYALAHVQFDEQRMPEAEANLRAYLRARPDDATAHYGLGRLLHVLLRNDEAAVELTKSTELQPRQSESYYELGEIAREANQFDEARRRYELVLGVAPHHGGALTGLGILAFQTKDYSGAGKYLRDAVTYAPDYVTAHHYYSLVLARLGRDADAKREGDLAATLRAREEKDRRGNQLKVLE
jgi:tetratricopeptide (TPR) repeat protein